MTYILNGQVSGKTQQVLESGKEIYLWQLRTNCARGNMDTQTSTSVVVAIHKPHKDTQVTVLKFISMDKWTNYLNQYIPKKFPDMVVCCDKRKFQTSFIHQIQYTYSTRYYFIIMMYCVGWPIHYITYCSLIPKLQS